MAVLTLEGMMWTIALKLLREGTVNLLIHTNVKKEVVKQVLMDALSRSLGLSLLDRVSMRARVKGSHLGHLEDGGARLAAPLRVALPGHYGLTMEDMPGSYAEDVVGKSGA